MADKSIEEQLTVLENHDHDIRAMALNDIMKQIRNGVSMDTTLEKKVMRALMKRFKEDQNSEVIEFTTSCLCLVLPRASEEQLGEVLRSVTKQMVHPTNNDEDDDPTLRQRTMVNCLSSVFDVIEDEHGAIVGASCAPLLLEGTKDNDSDIVRSSFDMLAKMLVNFSEDLPADFHSSVVTIFVRQLDSDAPDMIAAVVSGLGAMSRCIDDAGLKNLIGTLKTRIQSGQSSETCLAVVSGLTTNAGYRLGPYLSEILPVLLAALGSPDDQTMTDEAGVNLRERVMAGLGAFVNWCKRECGDYIGDIVKTCLDFVDHKGSDDGMEVDGAEEAWEDDDEDWNDDGDGYGDDDGYGGYGGDNTVDMDAIGGVEDDDISWRVRKAAVETLMGVIESRPDKLRMIYEEAGEKLVSCFGEKSVTVQVPIINCFAMLLSNTIMEDDDDDVDPVAMALGAPPGGLSLSAVPSAPPMTRMRSCADALFVIAEKTFQKAAAELKSSNSETDCAFYNMLATLVTILVGRPGEGGLDVLQDEAFPLVLKEMTKSLKKADMDNNANMMKVAACKFAGLLMRCCDGPELKQAVEALTPSMVACTSESTPLPVVAEALSAMSQTIAAIKPASGKDTGCDAAAVSAAFIAPASFWTKKNGAGTAVKTNALTVLAKLLARCGDQQAVAKATTEMLQLLYKAIGKDTIVAALTAFEMVASSPLKIDLMSGNILGKVEDWCLKPLNKASAKRVNKIAALRTLVAFTKKFCANTRTVQDAGKMQKLAALVNDSDLVLAALVMQLTRAAMVQSQGKPDRVLQQAKGLLSSPLLQGAALEETRKFFGAQCMMTPGARDGLIKSLLDQASAEGKSAESDEYAASNTANVVAHLVLMEEGSVDGYVDKFATTAASKRSTSSAQAVSLRCLGELGRQVDLSGNAKVDKVIMEKFTSEDAPTEVKAAATMVLGNFLLGAPDKFMPVILQGIADPTRAKACIRAVLDVLAVLVGAPGDDASKQGKELAVSVLPALQGALSSTMDATREAAGQCLGALCGVAPQETCAVLKKMCAKGQPDVSRAAAINALTYAVQAKCLDGNEGLIDFELQEFGCACLELSDVEMQVDNEKFSHDIPIIKRAVDVRTQSIELLMALLRSKTRMVRARAAEFWMSLTDFMTGTGTHTLLKKKQYIVERGLLEIKPFGNMKIQTAFDAPLRSAAILAIICMVNNVPEACGASQKLLQIVEKAMKDDDKVIASGAAQVLQMLVSKVGVPMAMLDPKKKSVIERLRKEIKGANPEVQGELRLLKACIRTAHAVSMVAGVSSSENYKELIQQIEKQPTALELWRDLKGTR